MNISLLKDYKTNIVNLINFKFIIFLQDITNIYISNNGKMKIGR